MGRRNKRNSVVTVEYIYIQPAAMDRLTANDIFVELAASGKWSVHFPTAVKTHADGQRVGIQLFDNSTLVSYIGPNGLHLYVTPSGDKLYRPSFDEVEAARAERSKSKIKVAEVVRG